MFEGELTPYPEVAEKLCISKNSMQRRLIKFENGEITEEQLLKPFVCKTSVNETDAAPPRRRGKRAEAMDHFLQCFDDIVKPCLASELETYMRTREEGPAMQFYKQYKDFLCIRDKASDLDGAPALVAGQAIVMPSGEQPHRFKKVK